MTVAACVEQRAAPREIGRLRGLSREMLQAATSAPTKRELLKSLADILHRHLDSTETVYCQRGPEGKFADPVRLGETHGDSRLNILLPVCQAACRTGRVELRRRTAATGTILAAPVPMRGGDPEALGVILPSDVSIEGAAMLLQMTATHVVLWHVLASGRSRQGELQHVAALVELMERVLRAPDLREACYSLVGELQSYLQCRQVALGLRRGGRCRLQAISGVAQFDHRSAKVQTVEAAMDEATLRREATRWPPASDEQRHGALAHKQLCSSEGATTVLSVPLRESNDDVVGALIVFDDEASRLAQAEALLSAAERPLASSLSAARRLEGGGLSRWRRNVFGFFNRRRSAAALAAIVLTIAVMTLPQPYCIRCNCQIEPVVRRYVVAPFEGTLETTMVKPGDAVHEGDLLARMDGRELRWQRAGLVADRKQAIKRRDAAQASRNYADQQIAQLEIERLDVELRLLDHRADNLEIRCPVDGVVATGDLERAEGAKLKIGQTLFEIAPLESMIVEVAAPDDEMAHIAVGQPVEVRLDAHPSHAWTTSVAKIHPRSAIREEENVFIAEAALENGDGLLRPGMKGRAVVTTARRPIGWILFHKPWEYLNKKLFW